VIDAVRDTIRRHAMLAGGETVLVAVSGGADSVALLHALRILAPDLRLTLSAVHVDHGLRPESGEDAAFVEALARSWGVPVAVERIAVGPGASLEARARDARYAALRRQAAGVGADRVALGHTADDQAETVLMRLLEGAGPRGLAGIPPVRGVYIRPLIETRRSAIVEELARAGLRWRDDPSNRDLKFLRNRIRHELLPLLAASYNPEIVRALGRAAALTRALLGEVSALAERELPPAPPGRAREIVLSRARLHALPREVAAEVLRLAAERLGHRASLRAWAHRGLRRVLLEPPAPRPFGLGALRVESSGDWVRLSGGAPAPLPARSLTLPGVTPLPEIGQAIEARRFERPPGYVVPRTLDRVAFDADVLPGELIVRPRQRGDRFLPFGGPGQRRLKSVLIDARVPRWERDRQPLVVAGEAIVWIVGLRRGAAAPVTDATRRVLELRAVPLAEVSVAEVD
jgi:tRNA(Ile)-lysidine synthase